MRNKVPSHMMEVDWEMERVVSVLWNWCGKQGTDDVVGRGTGEGKV